MIEVFFSYSHKDEATRDELETHMAMLKRQGVISAWHDRRIVAGSELDGEISANLERAGVILLLVSPYFLASNYCYDVEMRRAMERHAAGDARVIPIIVDPCDWHVAPFGTLLALPQDGKPISKFPNMHDAFLQITKEIRRIASLGSENPQPSSLQIEGFTSTAISVLDAGPRSSNLRVKKKFSQHDRDEFRESTFEYIAKYFEQSLKELESRNEPIETAFKRIDGNTFTASIYEDGEVRAECAISISNSFGGNGIVYSSDKSSRGNSFNNMLTIVDDGLTLGWSASLNFGFREQSEGQLTKDGAAESFWSILLAPLQR